MRIKLFQKCLSTRAVAAFILLGLLITLVDPISAQTTRTVRGDTTIVRTIGNGAWGPRREAVEMLRLTGPVGSDIEFGQIADMTALSTGGVAVFDNKSATGPALMILDSLGKLVRTLGRAGAGPGEYGSMIFSGSLLEGANGEILLGDQGNGRIDRWSASGTPLPAIRIAQIGGPLSEYIHVGPRNSLFALARVGYAEADPAYGFLQIDLAGRVIDTIFPAKDRQILRGWRYVTENSLQPLPDGRLASMRGDRGVITITSPPQSKVVRIEREPFTPVRILAAERAEWDAVQKYQKETMRMEPVPIPEFKPLFSKMQYDRRGESLWLWMYGPGEKLPSPWVLDTRRPALSFAYAQRHLYAVFSTDGAFLGEVSFPDQRVIRVSPSKSVAWGMLRNNDGEMLLMKWRIPQ